MARATALEVKERTATIKEKILDGSAIPYVLITCDKNGGCLARRLIATSSQRGLKFDKTRRPQYGTSRFHCLGSSPCKPQQVMRASQGAVAVGAVRELSILLGLLNPNTRVTGTSDSVSCVPVLRQRGGLNLDKYSSVSDTEVS